MVVDRPIGEHGADAPGRVEQLLTAQDASRVPHECPEQLELREPLVERLAGAAHPPRPAERRGAPQLHAVGGAHEPQALLVGVRHQAPHAARRQRSARRQPQQVRGGEHAGGRLKGQPHPRVGPVARLDEPQGQPGI